MKYIIYLLVFGFLLQMLFSGGMFSAAAAFGLVYLIKAAYEDFKYKPEEEEEVVQVQDTPESKAEPDSESEVGPEDGPDPTEGFSDTELAEELAIVSKSSGHRGNARAFGVDMDNHPEPGDPTSH